MPTWLSDYLKELYARLKAPLTWATITPLLVNVILPVIFTTLTTAQLQAINAGLSIVALLFFGVSAGVSVVRVQRARRDARSRLI